MRHHATPCDTCDTSAKLFLSVSPAFGLSDWTFTMAFYDLGGKDFDLIIDVNPSESTSRPGLFYLYTYDGSGDWIKWGDPLTVMPEDTQKTFPITNPNKNHIFDLKIYAVLDKNLAFELTQITIVSK